jgi:hypothetical protein
MVQVVAEALKTLPKAERKRYIVEALAKLNHNLPHRSAVGIRSLLARFSHAKKLSVSGNQNPVSGKLGNRTSVVGNQETDVASFAVRNITINITYILPSYLYTCLSTCVHTHILSYLQIVPYLLKHLPV